MTEIIYTDKFTNPTAKLGNLRNEFFPNGNTSVVAGWGYETAKSKLQAVQLDIYENLHSLIEEDTCSCGLVINLEVNADLDAILRAPGHRDHVTLKQLSYVTFRGKVNKRLWGLNGTHPVDLKWDRIVKLHFPVIEVG